MNPTPPNPRQPRLDILDGHPVPYSLTVFVDGQPVADANRYLEAVAQWLAVNRPGQYVQRVDGAYVFYSDPPLSVFP